MALIFAIGVAQADYDVAAAQDSAQGSSTVRDEAFERAISASSGIEALKLAKEAKKKFFYEDTSYTRHLMEIGLARSGDVSAPNLRAYVIRWIGVTYQSQGQNDKAIAAYRASIPYAEAGADPEQLSAAYYNIGNALQLASRYGEALRAYEQSIRVGAPLDRPADTAKVENAIGALYSQAELSEDAIDHFRRAEALAPTPRRKLSPRLNLVAALAWDGRLDEADVVLARLESDGTADFGRFEQGAILTTKSLLLIEREPLTASEYGRKAEMILESMGRPVSAAQARCHRVQAHAMAGDVRVAEDLAPRCLSEATKYKYEIGIWLTNRALAEMYEKTGEPGKALGHLKAAHEAFRARVEEVMEARAELAFADVQVARDRQTAALEKKRAQVALLDAERRRLQGTISVGVGIVLAVVAALLFVVFRTRMFSVALLERNIRNREMLLAEINHRVKNNLQIVASLLGLERRRMGEEDEGQSGMRAMQARILSMASIHEGLQNVTDGDHIRIDEYLGRLVERLNSLYSPEYPVTLGAAVSPTISMAQASPIGLIVCELVSNASKHAYEAGGEIRVSLNQGASTGEVLACVEDDGKGIPADFSLDDVQSLGLTLVKDLADQIGARLQVMGTTGGGTRFCLTFKAYSTGPGSLSRPSSRW